MTDAASWIDVNERYLGAAMAMVRLRLLRQATLLDGAGRSGTPPVGRRRADPAAPVAADADLAEAQSRLEEAERGDPPPAAVILSRRLRLSRFERDVLLLCAAMEFDTRTAALCARAHDDPHRPFPTFALALALFPDAAWDALSPERPLRYWRLIEIVQSPTQPLTAGALRADERIVSYLKGLNHADDRLAPYLLPFPVSGDADLPPSQAHVAATVASRLEQAADGAELPLVQLAGADRLSKQLVASWAAGSLGLRLCRMPADLLPAQAAELEMLARLWQRESSLLPLALYIDAHETEKFADAAAIAVARFVARTSGIVFLDVREPWASHDRESMVFDVQTPTPHEQRAAWNVALGDSGDDAAARFTNGFDLSIGAIERIGRAARASLAADDDGHPDPVERFWTVCVTEMRPRLESLAQRIDARATWDDIVLPGPELASLRQVAGQVRQRARVYDDWGFRPRMNRGLGISALFAGESGTGKTMGAEVLATDLGLDLYRIDLSAVVSKYIGETEKNLRRLFDAAENGGAILLFDEADALFGKRSEVKDSHDRYANIEVNYLLQRMEAYRGLAVLATNMKSALDPAFMRRLRFVVQFPFPGAAERRAIWQRAFPPEAPADGLDVDRLARLNLAGGSIHTIVLNAAFLAAERRMPLTTALVLEAARAEFRKLERPVDEADFRVATPLRDRTASVFAGTR